MKMFKTLATAVALCAAVVVQARPLEEIQKSGTIILGSEGQYAPFNFFKGKQLTGYEIEVAEAVVKKMGLKYEWKTVGFDALLTGLAQDRWDLVIASHAITDERVELPPSAPVAEPSDDADDERAPAFGDEPVSLRQRAWPFIQMIERALAADKAIVWGV